MIEFSRQTLRNFQLISAVLIHVYKYLHILKSPPIQCLFYMLSTQFSYRILVPERMLECEFTTYRRRQKFRSAFYFQIGIQRSALHHLKYRNPISLYFIFRIGFQLRFKFNLLFCPFPIRKKAIRFRFP